MQPVLPVKLEEEPIVLIRIVSNFSPDFCKVFSVTLSPLKIILFHPHLAPFTLTMPSFYSIFENYPFLVETSLITSPLGNDLKPDQNEKFKVRGDN